MKPTVCTTLHRPLLILMLMLMLMLFSFYSDSQPHTESTRVSSLPIAPTAKETFLGTKNILCMYSMGHSHIWCNHIVEPCTKPDPVPWSDRPSYWPVQDASFPIEFRDRWRLVRVVGSGYPASHMASKPHSQLPVGFIFPSF